MTDKKLTDNDIVMALEYAEYKVNGVVTQGFYLSGETFNAVVDLINRLQAEVERLRYNLEAVLDERADHSEAYKEFAERLKKKYKPYVILGSGVAEIEIDNLLKEMVGE